LAGETDEALAYDEFGVPTVVAGASLHNPFGFTGYQMDDTTGLYFAQARYYEPGVARFVSEDAIKDQLNWYTYCNNSPISWLDPTGYNCEGMFSDAKTFLADFWERVGIKTGVLDWIPEIPSSGQMIDSWTNGIADNISSFLATASGALLRDNGISTFSEIVLDYFKITKQFVIEGDQVVVQPFGGKEVPRFSGALNTMGKITSALGGASILLDIANTITADSGNSTSKRVGKVIIQSSAYGARNGIGKFAVFAGTSSSPYISALGGGALGIVIAVGGNKLVDSIEESLYSRFKIDTGFKKAGEYHERINDTYIVNSK